MATIPTSPLTITLSLVDAMHIVNALNLYRKEITPTSCCNCEEATAEVLHLKKQLVSHFHIGKEQD